MNLLEAADKALAHNREIWRLSVPLGGRSIVTTGNDGKLFYYRYCRVTGANAALYPWVPTLNDLRADDWAEVPKTESEVSKTESALTRGLSSLARYYLFEIAERGRRGGPSSAGTDAPQLEQRGLIEFVKETRSGTTWWRATPLGLAAVNEITERVRPADVPRRSHRSKR